MKRKKKAPPREQNWPALMGWAPICVSERHVRGYEIIEIPGNESGSQAPRYKWVVKPGFSRDRDGWCTKL